MKNADFDLEVTPMQETLNSVKSTLRKHFEIVDWQGVELIMAVAAAHYTEGEMLWLRLIGPSRCGKTELFRAIAGHPDCTKMEHITPAAMRGGYKKGAKLLDRINGKLVVTNDFATILTTRKEDRNQIFGLLRPIKDGELESDFGSDEGHLHQEVRFDWIVATTPVFEQYRQMESLLGERFVDLRWHPGNREEMAFKAGQNNPYLKKTIRPEIAANVSSLMERAKQETPTITLSDSEIRVISGYADKAAKLRTPVQRDRYRNIVALPEPEIGTELTQGFSRIVKGLKLFELEFEPYLNRFLWDGMPKLRSIVLTHLVKGETNRDELATLTKLSSRTIDFQLEDLRLLEVIDQNNQLCMHLHNIDNMNL